MLTALEAYAHAALGGATADDDVAAARRSLGVALGAAEASVERLLGERRRRTPGETDAMLLVSYARRLGTSLTAAHTLAQSDARVLAYVARVVAAAKSRVRGETVSEDDDSGAAPEGLEGELDRVVQNARIVGRAFSARG
jgi:hypothetical protein